MAQCANCYRTRQQARVAQPQALPGVQLNAQNVGRPTMQLVTRQTPYEASPAMGNPNVQRIVLPQGQALPQQQIIYR